MRTLTLILVLFNLAIPSSEVLSQSASTFKGDWQGTLNVGVDLHLVFHIRENAGGGLTSTLDSPDQSVTGIKSDSTTLHADSIYISFSGIKARFAGKISADTVIDGTFSQVKDIPLQLKRFTGLPASIVHSQTPKPPFPYKSEELIYSNTDKTLQYGATITIPPGNGPFPAAILITGSGPQNRDEEIQGHKTFAVIADALTRNGIVVLRVDDRGIGKSTGDFSSSTTADFATDVTAGVDFLLTRPEVNKSKVGLIGHSEGGMIAPIVASKRKDINFTILLAGPGVKVSELMVEQNAAILRSAGVPSSAVESYLPLYRKIVSAIMNAPDTSVAHNQVNTLVKEWLTTTDSNSVKALGLDIVEQRNAMTQTLVQGLSSKWFKYFLSFDPAPYIQQMTGKVLALNGEKDIQVIASSNLAGIEAALKKSKVKKYDIKLLPGLNHLFQTCSACTIQEYAKLEQTIAPIALKEMNDWLDKNVK